jgi:deazaflavin-dependent oxidoreductase (nitroreductase family)
VAEDEPATGATRAALQEVVEEMHASGPGEKARKFNEALIADYRATGGARTGEIPPDAVVLLTMTGAKSGITRTVPVGIEEIDGRLIVVASQSGLPKHPQWYYNIVANPTVTAEWHGEMFRARAVVLEGAERDEIFGELNETFHALQAMTTRRFPIIELRHV